MPQQWPTNFNDGPVPDSPTTPTAPVDRERRSLVDDQFSPQNSPSLTPRTPNSSAGFDVPLLPGERAPSRSLSSPNFVSSPLNPRTPVGSTGYGGCDSVMMGGSSGVATPRPRPGFRASGMHMNRMASEETQALGGSISPFSTLGGGARGSMVLYRLAAEDEHGALLPPQKSYAQSGFHRIQLARLHFLALF